MHVDTQEAVDCGHVIYINEHFCTYDRFSKCKITGTCRTKWSRLEILKLKIFTPRACARGTVNGRVINRQSQDVGI